MNPSRNLAMARPLLLLNQFSTMSQTGYPVVTLLLCAFALFICASQSRWWRRRRDKDPVIQLNNEDMICSFGFQLDNGEGSARSGEVSVWQKNILMGGKCQLPDFSGVIIYDAAGNIVPPEKASCALPCNK
ncbi:hypothetical protein U1Q18_037513 [Sarracenia purpurea var. burkii]